MPPEGKVTLSLEATDGWAVVTVSDTGPGIPNNLLNHVFDQGFTTRSEEGGQGLGLFIVRQIALAHGGTAEAASPATGGSSFTLRLPIKYPSQVTAHP